MREVFHIETYKEDSDLFHELREEKDRELCRGRRPTYGSASSNSPRCFTERLECRSKLLVRSFT